MLSEPIIVTRDCEAVRIPSGEVIILRAGTKVRITQKLGDTYTVMTTQTDLLRIDGKDADAIGKEVILPPTQATTAAEPADMDKAVWDQLRTIYDPEIPVNVVELGLVLDCKTAKLPAGGWRADVKMTLTAPGCGMGDVLKRDAERKLRSIPGVKEAFVDITLDEPWDKSRMSEAARLQLDMF